MVAFFLKKCLMVISNPLMMAIRYNLSQKVISLLETCFFVPESDMLCIDVDIIAVSYLKARMQIPVITIFMIESGIKIFQPKFIN